MPSRLDFYRAFIIVLTFLIFPLRQLLQAAPAADYKLVRTTVDHEKKVNTSRSLPSEEMTMSAGAGQFTYIQIWKDGSRQICQYYFTATFDKPPDQLTIGQEFPLNISLTCSASGDIKERSDVPSLPLRLDGPRTRPGRFQSG